MNVRWSQEELDLTGLSVLPFPSPPGPGWRRFSVGGVVADRYRHPELLRWSLLWSVNIPINNRGNS